MKYKLLKDLPFIKAGTIFGTGTWVGGGFGVDMGNDRYGSHNGTRTFEAYEEILLGQLIDDKEWIEKVPQTESELLDLYDNKEITRDKIISVMKLVTHPKKEEVG